MTTWDDIKYFKPEEFACKECNSDGTEMDLSFVSLLDELRRVLGFPIQITSGYRCPEYNEKVGGAPNSVHLTGQAADISATNSRNRFLIVSEALKLGFKRIGIAKTFIHLDNSQERSQDVLWVYS